MSNPKKGLGRGLSALFSNSMNDIINLDEQPIDQKQITNLKISSVVPNQDQPRKSFDENLLNTLASSIKEHGILQPILVRPYKDGKYQIIAGERRWRAAQIAGLKEIPSIIKDIEDLETMEIALIENLQRSDLNPIEEALSYKFLIEKYNMSQEAIADKVGKSRPVIANTLRLLNLPKSVINLIIDNKISAGHARSLLSLNDDEKIEKKANEIIENKLSVRQIEQSIKNEKISSNSSIKSNTRKIHNEDFYNSLQKDISSNLKRNIKINYHNNKLEIEYFNKQDLIDISKKLKEILK